MFPRSQHRRNPKLISAFGQALMLPLSAGVCVAERDPAQESQISAGLVFTEVAFECTQRNCIHLRETNHLDWKCASPQKAGGILFPYILIFIYLLSSFLFGKLIEMRDISLAHCNIHPIRE